MEEISIEQAIKLSRNLKKDTYLANPFYIHENCFQQIENDEILIYQKDIFTGGYNLLFVPSKKENQSEKTYELIDDDDIKIIEINGVKIKQEKQIEKEYIYKTSDFINMNGGLFKKFRKQVNRFKSKYNYKIYKEYPEVKIVSFIEKWAKAKNTKSGNYNKKLFEDDLENSFKTVKLINSVPNKSYFIEIDGKLAGFRLTYHLSDKMWVGIIQKVDYSFEGIARFLYHYVAGEYSELELFSTGTAAGDKKLAEYKKSLHPYKEKNLYLVKT